MDNEIRGILPDRILLTYFPLPFAGEIDGEQGKELLSLIEKMPDNSYGNMYPLKNIALFSADNSLPERNILPN